MDFSRTYKPLIGNFLNAVAMLYIVLLYRISAYSTDLGQHMDIGYLCEHMHEYMHDNRRAAR